MANNSKLVEVRNAFSQVQASLNAYLDELIAQRQSILNSMNTLSKNLQDNYNQTGELMVFANDMSDDMYAIADEIEQITSIDGDVIRLLNNANNVATKGEAEDEDEVENEDDVEDEDEVEVGD